MVNNWCQTTEMGFFFWAIFLCIRGSDLVIVIWHAEPSKWNKSLLCCQGLQSAVRKKSKPNQLLETGRFCYCRGLSVLEGLSCAKPNCFSFHQCCCKTLKSYWHTNYSCFQPKFHLPPVNNSCALAEESRELWLLPALTHLISNGISQNLCPGTATSRAWSCWQGRIHWVTVQVQSSCSESQSNQGNAWLLHWKIIIIKKKEQTKQMFGLFCFLLLPRCNVFL